MSDPDSSASPAPTSAERIEFLSQYITEHKRDLMAEVMDNRTRHVTIVLENIYQPHNASACLRTCDCLGVQDVHVIESRNEYRPNTKVALGSSKWLTMHKHEETKACLSQLKSDGFRIVATSPKVDGFSPATIPLDKPIAILFGTEETGISEEALEMADDTLRLPMVGFTQSYNISVTAAITLSRIMERVFDGEIGDLWKIDPLAREQLFLEWYRKVVSRHDLLEERHFGTADAEN